jgi:hypothetical protein
MSRHFWTRSHLLSRFCFLAQCFFSKKITTRVMFYSALFICSPANIADRYSLSELCCKIAGLYASRSVHRLEMRFNSLNGERESQMKLSGKPKQSEQHYRGLIGFLLSRIYTSQSCTGRQRFLGSKNKYTQLSALVERPYRPGRVDYKSERDAEEVGQPAVRLPQTLLPPMFIYCPINLAIVISVIMRTSAHHSIFFCFYSQPLNIFINK